MADLFSWSDDDVAEEESDCGETEEHPAFDTKTAGPVDHLPPPSPILGPSATSSGDEGRLLFRQAMRGEPPETSEEAEREGSPAPTTGAPRPRKVLPGPCASVVVVDSGSLFCKAGFGNYAPRHVFPTVVGRFRSRGIMIGMEQLDPYVGDEAWSKRGVLRLTYPVERGIVTNWDDMEKVWHHMFYNELKVHPEEHPVLLTEVVLNPKANREKMTQIMFETFNVPHVHVCVNAVLSLFVSGRETGLVLESGHQATHAVPVYGGYAMVHAVCGMHVAGQDITDSMMQLLNEGLAEAGLGNRFATTPGDRDIVRDIKEKFGYIALDFDVESKAASESSTLLKDYELPDGNLIACRSERFRAPEAMFAPELAGSLMSSVREGPSVHELVHNSAMRCKAGIHEEIFRNIVLAGGNTMFPNFAERLQREVSALARPALRPLVKVTAPPERKYSVWRGGSIFASHSRFAGEGIRQREYDESGPAIVHRNTAGLSPGPQVAPRVGPP